MSASTPRVHITDAADTSNPVASNPVASNPVASNPVASKVDDSSGADSNDAVATKETTNAGSRRSAAEAVESGAVEAGAAVEGMRLVDRLRAERDAIKAAEVRKLSVEQASRSVNPDRVAPRSGKRTDELDEDDDMPLGRDDDDDVDANDFFDEYDRDDNDNDFNDSDNGFDDRGFDDNRFTDRSDDSDDDDQTVRLGRRAPVVISDDVDAVAPTPIRRTRPDASGRSVASSRRSATTGSSASGPPRRKPDDEPATRASGGSRILTGVGLIVGAAIIIKFGGARGVVLLAMAAGVGAVLELFTALRQRGFMPAIIPGLLAAAVAPLAAYNRGEQGVVVLLVLAVFVMTLWFLLGPVRDRPVVNIAVSMLGLLYVGFAVAIVGLLLRATDGVALVVGAILGSAAHDIAALFIGKNAGRVPIAPEISPNKTLEGLIGGMVFGALASIAYGFTVAPMEGDKTSAILFGVIVACLAPLGDLVESMMKRDLGIKDMGSLLPGHGGILDRIDAMMFVFPGVYLLAAAKGWL